MREIKGKDVIAQMKTQMEKELSQLTYIPQLAIIRVGEKPDDIAYEQGATKRMKNVGLRCSLYNFPEDICQEVFVEEFQKINEDADVDGILLLRPLPKQIDEKIIMQMIDPSKDVEGISPTNIAKVFSGEEGGFAPCTAEAVVETLRYIGEPLTGKRVVVIGRSMVVGKPLSMLLLKENCTVTICHTKTIAMQKICQEADIVIACAGKAKMVDASYIGQGKTIIDVGIHVDEAGKLCGDVDYLSISEKAGAATPVPGGIGTITTSILARNVLRAARKRRK